MPKNRNSISLSDLKNNSRMTPIFFDTFFNLEKYLDHEQRDPFASQRDVDEEGNEVRSHRGHVEAIEIIFYFFSVVRLGQIRRRRVRTTRGRRGQRRGYGRPRRGLRRQRGRSRR